VCKEERRRRINTRYKSVPIPCIGHQPWHGCIAGIELWRSTCIQKRSHSVHVPAIQLRPAFTSRRRAEKAVSRTEPQKEPMRSAKVMVNRVGLEPTPLA
jgi:hypothetical protein